MDSPKSPSYNPYTEIKSEYKIDEEKFTNASTDDFTIYDSQLHGGGGFSEDTTKLNKHKINITDSFPGGSQSSYRDCKSLPFCQLLPFDTTQFCTRVKAVTCSAEQLVVGGGSTHVVNQSEVTFACQKNVRKSHSTNVCTRRQDESFV